MHEKLSALGAGDGQRNCFLTTCVKLDFFFFFFFFSNAEKIQIFCAGPFCDITTTTNKKGLGPATILLTKGIVQPKLERKPFSPLGCGDIF